MNAPLDGSGLSGWMAVLGGFKESTLGWCPALAWARRNAVPKVEWR